jgi:signal transduction histidine kinase
MITSINQFWGRNTEEKARPSPFRIACEVTYYDPFWNILFIKDSNGEGAYIPSTATLGHPFEFGQHLVVTGEFIPPGDEIRFDHAQFQVTGQSAPTPLPIAEGITDSRRYLNTFVSVEGIVDHYSRMDANHIGITLSTAGTTLLVVVLADDQTTVPILSDSVVRIEGIYNPRPSADGRITLLQVLVQGPRHLTVLHRLVDDDRFRIPVVPIASIPNQVPGRIAHVRGRVKSQEAGRVLRIRDLGGQIDVLSGQTRLLEADEWVEAVGYPRVMGTEMQLTDGIYRSAGNMRLPAVGSAPDNTISVSAHVLDLPVEEAAKGRAVQLSGVVTWSDFNTPFFFLQDSTGGVLVMKGSSNLADNHPGLNVEVTGVTGIGDYVPIVVASKCRVLGEIALPAAEPVTLERAYTGTVVDSWVEMSGYLRQIRTQGDINLLDMVTAAGEFSAVIPRDQDVASLVGGTLRVHGVCTAETDGKRKLTGIKLWVPSRESLIVDEARQKAPFDLPVRPLARLGQYNTEQSFNRMMHFSGVLLQQSIGHSLQIEDGGQGLRVYSQLTEPLVPGDQVDVVGFLAWQGGRVSLHDAIYRKTGHRKQPQPIELAGTVLLSAGYEGHLVRVEASLIDDSVTADQLRLTLQREKTVFEAYLSSSGLKGALGAYAPGSTLSLTGAYEVIYDEIGRPSAFRISLRGLEDISVLSRPPWLTRQRIMALSGALGVAILLFMGWVAALRRQVSKQTRQIQENLRLSDRVNKELVRLEHDVRTLSERRRELLEIQREFISMVSHEFRTPLTTIQGAHFLLEKLLTESANPNRSVTENAEKWLNAQALGLKTLNKLIDQVLMLTRIEHMTGEALLEQLSPATLLTDTVARFNDSVDRPRVVLHNDVTTGFTAFMEPGLVKAAAENLISNGLKYSGPDKPVQVRVYTEPEGWAVEVVDQGRGIPKEDQAKLFRPFFRASNVGTVPGTGLGLAIVRHAVDFHTGRVEFESSEKAGTRFRLHFPGTVRPLAGDAARGRVFLVGGE